MSPPSVALVGASGHGLWHRRRIAALQDARRLRLVALCDVNPITEADGAPLPADAKLFADHRAMLREVRPDVVVICTPPHTHLPIATDATRAGSDVLLEKPPVLSRAEHEQLAGVLRESGRVCQVGFQALGSTALTELMQAVTSGRFGPVNAISALGSWQRPDAYYRRSPWAGRRYLDGHPVVDGALENPFAHALMQCLALAAALGDDELSTVEFEGYRTRPIEVDDTACLRIGFTGGLQVVVAVTLCGEDFIAGEVIVHGVGGRAVLEYPTDRLLLPGEADLREVPGRIGLLENLLDHRADGAPLLVPLERTAGFTDLLEVIVAAPPARMIEEPDVVVTGEGPGRQTTIVGINAALRRAASELRLFRELGVGWSAEAHRSVLHRGGVPADGAVRPAY